MPRPEFVVGERDVQDVAGAYRYAVCDRDTRRVVIHNRSNGSAVYMLYHSERGAVAGLARAESVVRDQPLMVVDREAE